MAPVIKPSFEEIAPSIPLAVQSRRKQWRITDETLAILTEAVIAEIKAGYHRFNPVKTQFRHWLGRQINISKGDRTDWDITTHATYA